MRACGPAAPINSPTLARLIESGRPHRLHHTCGATRSEMSTSERTLIFK